MEIAVDAETAEGFSSPKQVKKKNLHDRGVRLQRERDSHGARQRGGWSSHLPGTLHKIAAQWTAWKTASGILIELTNWKPAGAGSGKTKQIRLLLHAPPPPKSTLSAIVAIQINAQLDERERALEGVGERGNGRGLT